MQKLIRRSPSGPPLLCTSSLKPSLPFLSLSFPFTNITSFTMPTATLPGSGSALTASAAISNKNLSFSRRFYTNASCISQPRLNTRTSLRAWPGRVGIRPAWCHSDRVEEPLNPIEKSNGLSESEDKRIRLNRRQKGSGSGVLVDSPDLLTIPGVGPRNLRKLVDNGIQGVAELKQLYKDKFFGKASEKMVEYLQSSVGIIHKNHAESITTYIKEIVDEDLKDSNSDTKPSGKKRLTFCVEGNISVGKSTFLQRIANETLELRDLVEIVPEPIDKWQNVGPDHFNILDAFYAEPQRYAYTFQNYVFVTRVMQERESSGGIKPLRLMERSVFSDRMVFVRAVHEANWMNEMEISIYDSWFDPVVSCLPGLIPEAFIYLRASPDTCHKRMMLRKREEEGGVSLDYLRDLHEKHESWFLPFESGNHGVLSVSKLPIHVDSSLHPDIRDRVFFLEGNHMHSSIQKVPALVLDCEPNIDFNRDIDTKRQYARQVAEFFEFVKKKQEFSATQAGEGQVSSQPQMLLPHAGQVLQVFSSRNWCRTALPHLQKFESPEPVKTNSSMTKAETPTKVTFGANSYRQRAEALEGLLELSAKLL